MSAPRNTHEPSLARQTHQDSPEPESVSTCPCGHRAQWHHETRGCGYLGHAPDQRCSCTLSCEDVVATLISAATKAATSVALEPVLAWTNLPVSQAGSQAGDREGGAAAPEFNDQLTEGYWRAQGDVAELIAVATLTATAQTTESAAHDA